MDLASLTPHAVTLTIDSSSGMVRHCRENPEKNWRRHSDNDVRERTITPGKRLIKTMPKTNDTNTIGLIWNGALQILNGEDRYWKQMLPRDLDSQEYCGREHV